jgi:hypothetical protein
MERHPDFALVFFVDVFEIKGVMGGCFGIQSSAVFKLDTFLFGVVIDKLSGCRNDFCGLRGQARAMAYVP